MQGECLRARALGHAVAVQAIEKQGVITLRLPWARGGINAHAGKQPLSQHNACLIGDRINLLDTLYMLIRENLLPYRRVVVGRQDVSRDAPRKERAHFSNARREQLERPRLGPNTRVLVAVALHEYNGHIDRKKLERPRGDYIEARIVGRIHARPSARMRAISGP